MSDLLSHLDAELALEEGEVRYLYDDVSGRRFLKGMTLVGNLTIATGVNLMEGMDDEELRWISAHRMQKVLDRLQPYQWFVILDVVRQAAVADIAFNIGLAGLLHWVNFLHYLGGKDYPKAVQEIASNKLWISQVKTTRAGRIEGMIATGEWPKDVHYV